MREIPLADLVRDLGQAAVAKGLNCSQPAIKKALDTGRQIKVVVNDDGSLKGEEVRPFPSQIQKLATQ